MPKQNNSIYFENLDALRAIAFGMVFIYHFFGYVCPLEEETSFLVTNLIMEGHLGVNLFFVLSGFLITYLLIAEKENTGRIHIGFFYMRRILRIWPLYFIAVITGFFIYPLFIGKFDATIVREHLPYYLLFASNFDRVVSDFAGIGNDNLGVLWSVAVEEQFYLFWPIVLSLVNKKFYMPLFISMIIASLTYRAIYADDPAQLYFNTFSVMSDLVVGASLAYCCYYNTEVYFFIERCSRLLITGIYILLFALILFLSYLFKESLLTITFERLVLSILFSFIIGEQCFAKNSPFKLGRFKKLSAIGIISYGLYCLHLFSISAVQKINHLIPGDTNRGVLFYMEFAGSLTLSIVTCYISYHYFEKRILKLKSKFIPINIR